MSESRGGWDTALVRPARRPRRTRPAARRCGGFTDALDTGVAAEDKGEWDEGEWDELPLDVDGDGSDAEGSTGSAAPCPEPGRLDTDDRGSQRQSADRRGSDRRATDRRRADRRQEDRPGPDPSTLDRGPEQTLDRGPEQTLDRDLEQLAEVVDRLVDLTVDSLSDPGLRRLLGSIQPPIARLQALRTRAAGELEARAVEAAGPGGEQRAEQQTRRWMRKRLGLTPGEAKQAGATGRKVRETPRLGDAHATATISEAHARIIAELLSWLPETMSRAERDEVEARLISMATDLDVIAFGRKARRLLAEIDLAAAEAREQRQHQRRRFSIGEAEDGAVVGSFRLYGLQAEKLRTALGAANQPDPVDGPVRTFEQRNADALEVICDLSLRSGDLPTQHGVRPHVTVLVEWSDLAIGAGIAELDLTGPITIASLRPLLRDCTVSRIILDPDSVPTEAGEAVRTVPVGLWRQLVARDRGCTWHDCDAPAAWCQVAHGLTPFREGGRLRLDDCALLCQRHHRIFDSDPWRLVIRGLVVRYERIIR